MFYPMNMNNMNTQIRTNNQLNNMNNPMNNNNMNMMNNNNMNMMNNNMNMMNNNMNMMNNMNNNMNNNINMLNNNNMNMMNNNMNMINNNINMNNNMNQQINNQMEMNMMNLMFNCMKNMNDLVQKFNDINKQKKQNEETKIEIIKNNKNKNKSILPKMNETKSHFAFPEIQGRRIYLIFMTSSGSNKVMMNIPISVTIGQIIYEYVKVINIGPNTIGTAIHFLFNGTKIKKSDFNKKPFDMGLLDLSNILVIDTQNLIAASNFY